MFSSLFNHNIEEKKKKIPHRPRSIARVLIPVDLWDGDGKIQLSWQTNWPGGRLS